MAELFRQKVKQRFHGRRAGPKLANKLFRKADRDRSHDLSHEEFKRMCNQVLRDNITNPEIDEIYKALDKNGDGRLTMREIKKVLRGGMPHNRKTMVKKLFMKADTNGDGIITACDLKDLVKVPEDACHRCKDDILREFMEEFEPDAERRNDEITVAELIDYYSSHSSEYPFDDNFKLFIYSQWEVDV